MTQFTRIIDRFAYHTEDLDCSCCLFKKRKSKHRKTAYEHEVCPFDDIRQDAIAHGRVKRKRRWFKIARSE